MSNFLKNIFSRNKPKGDKDFIELKYLEKYKDTVGWEHILFMLEEYKLADIIFEPIRKKLLIQDQENLYEQIHKSDFLSPLEKAETIVGLMMILDGSFPAERIIVFLKKVFGKEFIEMIRIKQDEFKWIILAKQIEAIRKKRAELTNKAKKRSYY